MTNICHCLAPLALITTALCAQQAVVKSEDTGRKVSVGSYNLFLDCTGSAPGPTVILLAGSGSTSKVWSRVQGGVAGFARVCSYDRMGLGQSDRAIPPTQTAWDIVEDLHSLLLNAGIAPPYILVGHSIGGIYARKFMEAYPTMVSGLVFVDSADEEQVWRFERITPILMFEYPGWPNVNKLAQAGWLTPGGLLAWHHDVPLVVLERGITWPRTAFRGMTESQYQDLKTTWHSMQVDLSTRSKYGELRIAEKSGHYIQTQQPELVVKAIHDVLGQSPR
jgi:pimeloyl-ACP methyl ester carboxylesterase